MAAYIGRAPLQHNKSVKAARVKPRRRHLVAISMIATRSVPGPARKLQGRRGLSLPHRPAFSPFGPLDLLHRLLAGLVGADPDRLLNRGDEDLSVPDLAGLGGLHDRGERALQ